MGTERISDDDGDVRILDLAIDAFEEMADTKPKIAVVIVIEGDGYIHIGHYSDNPAYVQAATSVRDAMVEHLENALIAAERSAD